jgi:hypothetical protein
MSKIRDALRDLICDFDERPSAEGGVEAEGIMRFGAALEGPPGRLHGGHHAHVRTLPILERLRAHSSERTTPCALDVQIRRALPLEEPVPFEARYRSNGDGWELTTRFDHSDRLVATVRSIPPRPLLGDAELAHLRSLYEASTPAESSFRMFGVTVQLAPGLVFVDSRDPLHAEPTSQLAAMTEADGTIGPALMATQLDSVGAVAQGTRMRHPHFTKRIELSYAPEGVPAGAPFLFLADRTTIEEDVDSETPKVEIKGRLWGTACIRVALIDAGFERAFAVGRVTVHPVDPNKFEPLQKMRQLRGDLPG